MDLSLLYTATQHVYSAASPLFTPLSSTDELPVSFLENFRLEEVNFRRWQPERCVWGVKWSGVRRFKGISCEECGKSHGNSLQIHRHYLAQISTRSKLVDTCTPACYN